MIKHLKDILIFLTLLAIAFVLWTIFVGMTAIDIQLHDTYFVFDWFSWTFLITGSMTFFYFLARGLTRKFSDLFTNSGLLVGLIAILVILFKLLQMMFAITSSIGIGVIAGLVITGMISTVIVARRVYSQWRREYSS